MDNCVLDHTKELIKKAHDGDVDARNQLVTENMGLIWNIVKRFGQRGHDMEDLFQIGSIGLIKAVDRFDTEFDVKFSTYAVPMITGEIKRFLRDDGMVKISRSLKENAWKIKKASQELAIGLGRDASVDELCEATQLTREEIVMAMEASNEIESIYQTVYKSDGSEITMVDKIVGSPGGVGVIGDSYDSYDAEKDKLIDNMVLKQLMDELDEKEKCLIQWRYFDEKTQCQVAQMLGISQVQVSRMEKKILLGMRKKMVNR